MTITNNTYKIQKDIDTCIQDICICFQKYLHQNQPKYSMNYCSFEIMN